VKEPESEHISLTEALVFSDKPSAKANLPGGVIICRHYDCLTVMSAGDQLPEIKLNCPGQTIAGNYRFICVPANDHVNTATMFTLPQGDWIIRSRRAGDEIRLSGGTKSLKKLFIDRKIPADLRAGIPVIADGDTVAAVYGIGINHAISGNPPAWRVTVEELTNNPE
jgi:tRNA(Ile)-lysidine synthase